MHKTRRLHATMLGLGTMLAALGLAASTHAQTQLTEHTASDGAAGDKFGQSVGVSGDFAVVGSPFDNNGQGAAYVLHRSSGAWSQVAKLTASDGASANDHRFGSSVAISGNVIVVGAPTRGTAGAVYVFRLNVSTWAEEAILTGMPADTEGFAGDHMGDSVAIEGDRIVAGAPDGAHAHLFEYNGDDWLPVAELSSLPTSAPGSTSQFGYSVSVSGDSIAVGARNDSVLAPEAGAAYVFVYDAGENAWEWQATIRPSVADANAVDQFGNAVSISGNTLAIGAPGDDSGAGATYVYDRSGVWNQSAKLVGGLSQAGDAEGWSVALQGDRLASGAYQRGGSYGAVHLYQYNGADWLEDGGVPVDDFDGEDFTNFGDELGTAVAVDGDLMLTGIPGKDLAGAQSGSVLFFEFGPPPTPTDPDPDGDGLTTSEEEDLQELNGSSCPSPMDADSDDDGLSDGYENTYGPGICTADTDSDGLLDGDEVNTYLTEPMDDDSDDDGLEDGPEVLAHGTNPNDNDTDGDGLEDGLEIAYATNPLNADTDGDDLSDSQEIAMQAESEVLDCPSPLDADSDGDGLEDGHEDTEGWNPCDTDTDGDSLSDGHEVNIHGTDPFDPDTDDDSLDDGTEVDLAGGGSCPDPNVADSDGDGTVDGDEVVGTCGPCENDADDDGLCAAGEALAGTNPNDPDSDDDGLLDGAEVATNCTNPLAADSDGDTLPDGAEVIAIPSTLPCDSDTDGDLLPDNLDPNPVLFTTPAMITALTLCTAGEVQDTPAGEFQGPNNNVRLVRRTVLSGQITLAAAAIHSGHYNAARALLTLSLTRVDGASPPADWMDDGCDKDAIRLDLENLLAILELID